MNICAECGHRELPGALFCTECGEHMLELGGLPAVSDELSIVKPPDLLGKTRELAYIPTELMVLIPASSRRLKFSLDHEIRVGRGDDNDPHAPEINLARDSDSSAGVSRQHALIRLGQDGHSVVVIDLQSTNGTYLNHFRLPPDLPYPINHGDEIYFGHLMVHVFIR